jgi:DNA-directed RNA polymerase subunit N
MIPVRCFSCGKVIAEYYDQFIEGIKKGKKIDELFNELGIERYCCRRMLLTSVEFIDELNKYKI